MPRICPSILLRRLLRSLYSFSLRNFLCAQQQSFSCVFSSRFPTSSYPQGVYFYMHYRIIIFECQACYRPFFLIKKYKKGRLTRPLLPNTPVIRESISLRLLIFFIFQSQTIDPIFHLFDHMFWSYDLHTIAKPQYPSKE